MTKLHALFISVLGGGTTGIFTKEYITEIAVSVFIGVSVTVLSFLIINRIQRYLKKKNK